MLRLDKVFAYANYANSFSAPRNMANSCLLFLFLVRMTAGFNDSLVQITEPPSDTTAEIGQEVLLKCRVNHTRHPVSIRMGYFW